MTTTTAPLTPATYTGSLTQFHGPVQVELDRDGIARFGELRFVAWLPDGTFLTRVSHGSLDFSRPTTPTPTVPVVTSPYCRDHDFFDCPFH